jgi:hypothetical protein
LNRAECSKIKGVLVMSKITFESDDPEAVEAFADAMAEASMNCRIGITGRCELEGTADCEACPFSGELRSKRRAQTKG